MYRIIATILTISASATMVLYYKMGMDEKQHIINNMLAEKEAMKRSHEVEIIQNEFKHINEKEKDMPYEELGMDVGFHTINID